MSYIIGKDEFNHMETCAHSAVGIKVLYVHNIHPPEPNSTKQSSTVLNSTGQIKVVKQRWPLKSGYQKFVTKNSILQTLNSRFFPCFMTTSILGYGKFHDMG